MEKIKIDDSSREHTASVHKRALGICVGASTVSVAQVEIRSGGNGNHAEKVTTVTHHALYPHGGNPKKVFLSIFDGMEPDKFDTIAVTGRKFQRFINLPAVSEPEAVEYAYRFLKPQGVSCPAVVSAGGETFMVYMLDAHGRISNVLTGNKCASGTGEFFVQQLRRMDLSLDEISGWSEIDSFHHVSGRCSVFCKSDCTHATNKGIPKIKVTAGLCKMMSDKILELLKKVKRENIMLVGGTALNQMMIRNLKKEIPGMIVPKEAPYFEALGTALWALENGSGPCLGTEGLLKTGARVFEALPPLSDFRDMVTFKTIETAVVRKGDICLLGLDVGSTTTKAVLLRKSDNAMLASIYLRTNGDPVGASRECYRAILQKIKESADPSEIHIHGLGVCGSGRQIAGLHALTDGVVNEIIAHATAAVYFDPDVDTIFEIGGQDAKYTYITSGVSSDYAMNEACSAGTGSFLEESALESLGVRMEEIADIALRGNHPPNFNDQCAAFIASDIKNAIHEGVQHEDIVAGLVYSICMNYSNRVKSNRPVGEKVFMQGGVCYNKAVPLAMASLVGKPIIVPPEPGLMGAFGAALEVGKRMDTGLMEPGEFHLQVLADREVTYGKSFICHGGGEGCDRKCEIAMIHLDDQKFPFGGACNRYYNIRKNIKFDVRNLDLVKIRQQLVFEKYAGSRRTAGESVKGRVGINRSFLVNTYFPLFSVFFQELGYEVVLPETVSQAGIDQREAAFCYPAELAHGFFHSLLHSKKPDFLFLPHLKAVPNRNGQLSSQVCPFVQGETFYLQATFQEKLDEMKNEGLKVIAPYLDFKDGFASTQPVFVSAAHQMGIGRREAEKAFATALNSQKQCMAEMREIGKQVLAELETDPDKTAVVLFGRPYNGFAGEANMGIPHKFASRGVLIIPFDFLPCGDEKAKRHMYWGMGERILKACRYVERHPQLFGTYITNFSCGPDSFIIGYFRNIMGKKPSLTLELDSHTADAGLETRIEAFLDIVAAYRHLVSKQFIVQKSSEFTPAQILFNTPVPEVRTSSGAVLSMTDPQVTLLFPSMGRFSTESFAAVFRSKGFHAVVHPPSDEAVLKLGRANTSCKECLPLILTTGTLLDYVYHQKKPDEKLVYFMPTGAGPCRFGQYFVFMEDLIKRMELEDVALLSLTSENSYAGLGSDIQLRVWWAIVISDVVEDMRSMILANAKDTDAALDLLEKGWQKILLQLEHGQFKDIEKQLMVFSSDLRKISLIRPPETVPTILIAGEIFVRRDGLSRQFLTEYLADKGFASICSPIAEWILYSDYLVDKKLVYEQMSMKERITFTIKKMLMSHYEKRLKRVLSESGLFHLEPFHIGKVVKNGSAYISPKLAGEAILTIGSSLEEIATHACGVIAVGPFGCMPNRMSEAILNRVMNATEKIKTDPKNRKLRQLLAGTDDLPFLAVESDGSPFPQLINAKLETFCLRAERFHEKMKAVLN
ncbi:MAG: activase [Desulfobacteraceae bacterium]|nr:MAG: activase [Desulfobacteraceae bacterium]